MLAGQGEELKQAVEDGAVDAVEDGAAGAVEMEDAPVPVHAINADDMESDYADTLQWSEDEFEVAESGEEGGGQSASTKPVAEQPAQIMAQPAKLQDADVADAETVDAEQPGEAKLLDAVTVDVVEQPAPAMVLDAVTVDVVEQPAPARVDVGCDEQPDAAMVDDVEQPAAAEDLEQRVEAKPLDAAVVEAKPRERAAEIKSAELLDLVKVEPAKAEQAAPELLQALEEAEEKQQEGLDSDPEEVKKRQSFKAGPGSLLARICVACTQDRKPLFPLPELPNLVKAHLQEHFPQLMQDVPEDAAMNGISRLVMEAGLARVD